MTAALRSAAPLLRSSFFVYAHFGLHATFIVPGLLGLIWLFVWRRVYALPENHPRITAAEKQLILGDRQTETSSVAAIPVRKLLSLPQTWGTIVARSFTDPVWFFIADWFPIYLMSKGISVVGALISVWIPFIAADLGNFFGGWLSGYFIARGWPLLRARKAVVILGGIGVLTIIPTVFTTKIVPITCLFAIATFCYGCFITIANVLPSDLFPRKRLLR